MPKTSRQLTVHPLTLREVEVVRTTDVSPGMRRVTLGGVELGAFTSANGHPQPPFTSPAFDDDIRLLFPYPGASEAVLPVQNGAGLTFPREPRPLAKVYTVRRWDAESGELDVDFVRHGVGVATTWAYRAEPGDRIHLFGPGVSRSMPTGADWLLVAGDDTALPAIARMLEELPGGQRAQVFIEIAEDAHRQELSRPDGVEITWLPRGGAEPGTTNLLLDAVKNAEWWEGRPFAWVAGEQAAVRDIRRHLVEDRDVPKVDIEFTGYWRRAEVVALADDGAIPDPERNTPAHERFHDLVELYPPIAIRVAVGLGIGDLISRGVTTVPDLASRTGSDQRALGKLLRYLHALDVLAESGPGRYKLTEVGEFMTNEFWIDTLHPDGMSGRQHAGIYGLAESIRTGGPSYRTVTGHDFATLRTEKWYEDKYLERVAGFFAFIAEPLAKAPALNGVEHLVVHSGGAGVVAREATAVHPDLRVTICALPAQADWLRRDLAETIPDEAQRGRVDVVEQSVFEPSPEADAVLFASPRAPLPDSDAVDALRRAMDGVRPNGRILLVENTFDPDELDEHDCEADLLALTRDGTGVRTVAELDSVIELAGLRVDRTSPLGRAATLRELVPAEATTATR
ncbi:siderophore-interacting protein [Tsukamurella sp. 8F]|uniref:siderophore-interacting protein n=1 Tax=unclassified Tsukamurella TaxID=2633480 RepID=UPI0023B8D306|nr:MULTISPECIES: siderophore-interacting protein [unclassified Tsukamurella]MDF0531173.1 siderophore-interacting protein [Tsukamurella sp. 8J]MDF0585880.1 siderophore-interacting protein [Tsukamurella sp. 8F]